MKHYPEFINTWFNGLTDYYTPQVPAPLDNARLLWHNPVLARELALEPELFSGSGAGVWGGETLLPGMQPLAQVYSGHQFGVWAGQLGDGRGIMLGEQHLADGRQFDWHLKGAGLTPYSRMGDGRAVVRSTLREALASEAMYHLGIPTTRALSMVISDTPVYRERVEQGAMLMRIAQSHLRFGHVEHYYYRREPQKVKALVDYAIARHWPHFVAEPEVYTLWFRDVVARTARLIAQWQCVGFAHGVMNTDNMSLLGLTIDYGPYGFMDDYHPGWICNHSDYQGRYAFDQQPTAGYWNLQRLGQALSTLVGTQALNDALGTYQAVLMHEYGTRMRAKLGFFTRQDEDNDLLCALFALMEKEGSDYTRTFRLLCSTEQRQASSPLRDTFIDRKAFDSWFARYRQRLTLDNIDDDVRRRSMKAANPALVLRNWLAQRAIEGAERGESQAMEQLLEALRAPFLDRDDDFTQRPSDEGRHLEVSCSS